MYMCVCVYIKGGGGILLRKEGDSSLLHEIFIKKRNIKMISNLLEFSKSFSTGRDKYAYI